MENGSTTEIGVIGNQGMVGLPIILNTSYTNSTAIVQVAGSGYRIAAEHLRSQTAACNRYHNLKQRFARWLLTVQDNIQEDDFKLTQEFISQMLGVRRTGVTEVAHKFQKAYIIRYKRGSINIVSRERLEACTCECYWLIAKEYSRLLDSFD